MLKLQRQALWMTFVVRYLIISRHRQPLLRYSTKSKKETQKREMNNIILWSMTAGYSTPPIAIPPTWSAMIMPFFFQCFHYYLPSAPASFSHFLWVISFNYFQLKIKEKNFCKIHFHFCSDGGLFYLVAFTTLWVGDANGVWVNCIFPCHYLTNARGHTNYSF